MSAADLLLFATESGEVYAAGLGRLVLTFKEHWMVLDREGYLRFRHQVARLAVCSAGRTPPAGEGIRLVDLEGGTRLRLTRTEAEELVWLLDSAHDMLIAREALLRGVHSFDQGIYA